LLCGEQVKSLVEEQKLLESYGIEICCYIDTKRGRQLDYEVHYYQDIPSPEEIFVLTYIKQVEAREEIRVIFTSKRFLLKARTFY